MEDETRCEESEPRRRSRAHHHHHRRHRKERVLHTRISEPLAEDIRRMAEELRVPVSNLVRNVLEEAFSVVEAVTDNVGELIEDVAIEAERAREDIRHRHRRRRRRGQRTDRGGLRDAGPEPSEPESEQPPHPESDPSAPPRREFPDVVGWQTLILNRSGTCADCGAEVAEGERAYAGATLRGLADVVLCSRCLQERH